MKNKHSWNQQIAYNFHGFPPKSRPRPTRRVSKVRDKTAAIYRLSLRSAIILGVSCIGTFDGRGGLPVRWPIVARHIGLCNKRSSNWPKTRKFHLSVVVNEAYNVWAKSDTFARWSFMITATLQVTQCSHLMDSGLISCKLFLQDQTTFKGQDQVISWSMKYRKKNFATWFRKE